MRRHEPIGAVLAMLVVGACGSATMHATAMPSLADMQVLASSSVPGVPSVTTVLTVAELARDASIPDLAANLTYWGYLDGRERVFQGNSRHLMLVISRALIFKDTAGAINFVAFVKANSVAYFGGLAAQQPLEAQGRAGWVFMPQPCACHLANPAVIAVLGAGPGVAWLEINGPDATPALLVSLLDPAHSESTALKG